MVRLSFPPALTQLALVAIVTTDVVMMGWLGAEALAAGALAGHYFWIFEFFAFGLLGAVAPILAHHLGARRFRMVRPTVRQGFWMAIIIALPSAVMLLKAGPVLVFLGQDPDISSASQSYLRYLMIGVLPAFWNIVLSDFLIAHGRPRATLVISVAGIAINGLADYAFIFGHFGFPAMGLVGAGIASAIVKTLMFLATLGFVLTDRRLARYRLFGYFWRPDWPRLREIVTVGVPIAMTEMAEGGVVLVAYVLMGLISVDALAAHGVTVQCIIIVIIVPVGLMQAASVRVGRAAGASDYPAATRAGRIAIGLGLVYSFVIAAAFLLFGDVIVGVFLDDSVAENRLAASLAVSFLAIGGIFFIADSTQIITRGALMGLKDTRTPMVFALGSYGLTLPAAGFFAVYLGYGGEAIWLCMLVSAVVLAVMLVRRFQTKCMRLIELAEAA
jgi:MATE family multidrug resistance protein